MLESARGKERDRGKERQRETERQCKEERGRERERQRERDRERERENQRGKMCVDEARRDRDPAGLPTKRIIYLSRTLKTRLPYRFIEKKI